MARPRTIAGPNDWRQMGFVAPERRQAVARQLAAQGCRHGAIALALHVTVEEVKALLGEPQATLL